MEAEVSYLAKELVSSSDVAKKFGSYLEKIKQNDLEKLAVLKNSSIDTTLFDSSLKMFETISRFNKV